MRHAKSYERSAAAKAGNIGLVHEKDLPRAADATEAVVVTVHCGIELIVAAGRDQLHDIGTFLGVFRHGIGDEIVGDQEVRLACLGFPHAVARGQRTNEAARLKQALVVVLEHDWPRFFHRAADGRIVGDPVVPLHAAVGCERRLRQLGNDLGLGQEVGTGGSANPREP